MISTEDLRFIRMLAGHRTLADLARAMNVTPPSVTQRLKHIEDKLSTPLVQRPSRTISLTEEGLLLLEKGLSILNELDELQEQLADRKRLVSGKLRVLAPLGFGNEHVAPLLGEYKRAHPQLDVELELSDNPVWSSCHKWDVIIYIGALRDSSLKMVTLARNRRFICASPAYLAAHGEPRSPRELLQHQCIALRENNEDVTLWSFRHRNSNKEEVIRIHPQLASNEGRVVKDWALAGLGIIMRSEWDVQAAIDSGGLVRLLPDYRLPDADIVALVSGRGGERSARVSGFLATLKAGLQPAPWLAG